MNIRLHPVLAILTGAVPALLCAPGLAWAQTPYQTFMDGRGPGSLHYWFDSRGPGSEYYWYQSRERGSEYYWYQDRGPLSEYYWENGQGRGSEYYWLNGQGDWSQHAWQQGTSCVSEYRWMNEDDCGMPPDAVIFCLGARVDIEPCRILWRWADAHIDWGWAYRRSLEDQRE